MPVHGSSDHLVQWFNKPHPLMLSAVRFNFLRLNEDDYLDNWSSKCEHFEGHSIFRDLFIPSAHPFFQVYILVHKTWEQNKKNSCKVTADSLRLWLSSSTTWIYVIPLHAIRTRGTSLASYKSYWKLTHWYGKRQFLMYLLIWKPQK